MRTTAALIGACLFLMFVAFKSYTLYLDENKAKKRMIENLKAVEKENEYFKGKTGELAVKITAQELTISELRKVTPAMIEQLKSLYIKPAQLHTYTTAATETENRIITTLKDSIVLDTVRVSNIDYFDEWFDITGTIRNDTATLDISSRDQLIVITYMGQRPKKFLFVRYGPRHPETVVTNKNPNSKISIEKSIVIKKP